MDYPLPPNDWRISCGRMSRADPATAYKTLSRSPAQ
jgi:hypothetical protein